MNWQKSIQIQTAEGITFPIVLADPICRMAALVVDLLIVQIISQLLVWPLALLGLISPDLFMAVLVSLSFMISITYPMLMEWRCQGRTVGKLAFRLQVIDADGFKLKPEQVIVRNLLRFVDTFPMLYLFGGICAFYSSRGQRLGDIAARTVVTRLPPTTPPDLDHLLPEKFNSLRQHPHLVARARQRFSPEEAGLILDAIIRRDQFETSARLDLFRDLRTTIEQRVRFPENTTLGMSDEIFTRNIADILFR
jgi:uncharacterized RDD family membrane protein YckC